MLTPEMRPAIFLDRTCEIFTSVTGSAAALCIINLKQGKLAKTSHSMVYCFKKEGIQYVSRNCKCTAE